MLNLIDMEDNPNTASKRIISDKFVWKDLECFKREEREERELSQVLEINKMIKYFEHILIEKKTSFGELDDMKSFVILQEQYKLLKGGKFSWEKEVYSIDKILNLVKNSVSRFDHPFDIEMLNTNLFKLLFPIDLIDKYLSVVNRSYGKEVYDLTLRLQTNLTKIFLFHHLQSDTRFNLHISTDSINFMDPFLRIKIRETNKNQSSLIEKYFSTQFNIKKFVLKLLDLYFPNVACRYIGGGMEMHKYSLKIILLMFELGFWNYEELTDLVNVLFQKLENLLKLEDTTYKDFEKLSSHFEEVCTQLRMYFYECKEIVTAICIHIVILMNDRSFMQSHRYFNKSQGADILDADKCWINAYFNNSDISNIIHRILSMYILRTRQETNERLSKKKTIQYACDLIMVITDMESDLFYSSSNSINQSMLEFYTSITDPILENSAADFQRRFVAHLDEISNCGSPADLKKIESGLVENFEKLLTQIAHNKDDTDKRTFQYSLAMQNLPKIILCIQNLLNELKASQDSRIKCSLALIESCNGSNISQIGITDESGLKHLKMLFDFDPFATVIILEGIFLDDYSLMFGHQNLFNFFLSFYQAIIHQFKETCMRISAKDSLKNSSVKEWFSSFKQPIMKDEKDNQLELILTVFIYTRWIYNVLDFKDSNFESKFTELTIQESICDLMFDFAIKIIMDDEFLGKIKEGLLEDNIEYFFKPYLENATPGEINELIKKQKMQCLSEIELKNTIFETSMMILKLMCKTCNRFFTNHIYWNKIELVIGDLLLNTEYMFRMRGGWRYRASILELYSIFKIFPNNHLLSNRETHFQAPTSFCEVFIKEDHLSGELVDEICRELKRMSEYSKIYKSAKEVYSEGAETYFFQGIFPLLMKYCQGMLHLYSRDSNLHSVFTCIRKLQASIIESTGPIRDRFGLNFDYTQQEARKLAKMSEQESFQSILSVEDLLLAIGERSKLNKKMGGRRRPDVQERIFPNLYELREILQTICLKIEKAYELEDDNKMLKIYNDIKFRTARPTVLSDYLESGSEKMKNTRVNPGQIKISQRDNNRDIMQTLLVLTGLESEEMRYFKEMMEAYLINKRACLSKPRDENMFVKFLESKSGSVENIIEFIISNTNELFGQVLIENSAQEEKNEDIPIIVFLQNQFMFSLMIFLDRIVQDCVIVKKELHSKVHNSKQGKNFMSIMTFVMNSCFGISLHKTFLDYDWKLISSRFKVICSFFKNLCDDNFTPFKKEFSEFKPTIPALKEFHKGHSLFYGSYIRLESSAMRFDLMNTSNRLMLGDRSELYPILFEYIKLVTECVAGPYSENQQLIYTYRTDLWIGIVHRIIDDLNSNIYELKIIVLNYILALTEGNTETTCYFGANTTFDSLFSLIYTFLKRLYIYATVAQDKQKYKALVKSAATRYKEQMVKEKRQREMDEKQDRNNFSFYSKNLPEAPSPVAGVKISHSGSLENEESDDVFFDPNKSHVISKEIMECVRVDDYKAIMKTYMNNNIFCNHPLMKVVLRLNTLLLQLADNVAGYGICLENVYKSMTNKYGEDVPIHIRSKLGNYKRKRGDTQFSEKHVFYMFLTKITSDIEIRDPDSGTHITIIFPLQPSTFFLSEKSKVEFKESVDLENNFVLSLTENYPKFEIEMEGNLQLYRKSELIYQFSSDQFFTKLEQAIWCLCLLLNLVILLFHKRNDEHRSVFRNHMEKGADSVIAIISTLIISLSLVALFLWGISRYKQKWKISEITYGSGNQYKLDYSKLLKRFKTKVYDSILMQPFPLFFSIHILSNILGRVLSPFWYTLQLLTIVILSQRIIYVLRTIIKRIAHLASTYILILLVIFCYSVLTSEYFSSLRRDSNEFGHCEELWECFIYISTVGLTNYGGVGEKIEHSIPFDPTFKDILLKYFYDISFFLIVNIFALTVISSLIIDAFAEMREEITKRGRPY